MQNKSVKINMYIYLLIYMYLLVDISHYQLQETYFNAISKILAMKD